MSTTTGGGTTTGSASLKRVKGWCGHYTSMLLLSTALTGGALGYYFGMGYWEADDDQIVWGALAIFFVFCWSMCVRYANVPERFRENIPWLVEYLERVTAWSAQTFLVFTSAAIINEKVLRPLVTCTDSRQSTALIAMVAFFSGSVALPEPTQVNSLVVNLLFLLSVVLRNYNGNSTTFYVTLLTTIGGVLLMIRYAAYSTKVFTRRTKRSADQLDYRQVQSQGRGITKPKSQFRGYLPHLFWDICHQLNISWATVFAAYYMFKGWADSLDLHEKHFWIPLTSGLGAALVRFIMTRFFWGRIKREMQLDDVQAGTRVFNITAPVAKQAPPQPKDEPGEAEGQSQSKGFLASARDKMNQIKEKLKSSRSTETEMEGPPKKRASYDVARSDVRAAAQPVRPMGEPSGSGWKMRPEPNDREVAFTPKPRYQPVGLPSQWRTTPSYTHQYQQVYADDQDEEL